MSLTVPTSGSTAGRSAEIRVAPDQTAEIVTRFAQQMAEVGVGLENDRLQRQSNRLGVDMARDFNNLSLELQQIGDPDQLDQMFQTRSAEIRQSYLSGTDENGRPRVDPRNAEQFGLAFDDLANRHAYSVGARALEARQSQREATYLQYRQEAVTAVATAPEARDFFLEGLDAQIDQRVAAGTISYEQGAAEKLAVRADTSNALAMRMVADDPDGYLVADEGGLFNDLPPETRAGYVTQSQNSIATRTQRAQAEAERLAEEQNRTIGARLDDMATMFLDGRSVVDEQLLSQPEYQNHPSFARTEAARQLRAEGVQLPTMTLTDLRARVAQERGRAITEPWEQARLDLLTEQLARAEQGWTADPVGYAASVGLNVPARPDFDPAAPQGFATFLSDRRAMGTQLVQQGYTTSARVLSEDDRAYVQSITAIGQSPEDRAAAAAVVVAGLPGQGPDSAAALINDPVFLHMGALMSTGVSQRLAAEVFRGQQEIEAGNVILPSNATRLGAAGQTMQQIFGDIAGGATEQARVRAATDALYASRMRRTDPANADDIDEGVYLQALFEVMGGSGSYDSRDALGGNKELNGYQTVLPRGVSAAMAETAILNVGYDAAGTWTPATMATQLTAASLTGAPPALLSEADFWDELQGARFQSVGNDQYVIVFDTATGPLALQDTNNREFRLSLSQLIAQVPQ